MIQVAIVEDEYESAEAIESCLKSYSAEFKINFNIVKYKNGLDFLEEYKPDFDIIFMDIDMPHMNGLQTARELRKKDSSVVLIFVTFLAKYAIKGYEVDALDYVLKPINYNAFKMKIDRAVKKCRQKIKSELIFPSSEGTFRVNVSALDYIEISGHDIVYHTTTGNFCAHGTLRAIEDVLPEKEFFKCNRCYIVNLRNVTRIDGNVLYIGDDKLIISRPRKQAFMDAFHEYTMGGK